MPDAVAAHQVVPIVILASEYADAKTDLRKKAEVAAGVENFLSVNRYVREWYRHPVGRTYLLAPAKIAFSKLTAQEWLDLSESSVVAENRFDFVWRAFEIVEPDVREDCRYSVTVFAGNEPEAWLGAAAAGNVAVVPPRAASVRCPVFTSDNHPPIDERSADAAYALAHELGHAFGLPDSAEVFTDESHYRDSFMHAAKPPQMGMLAEDRKRLRESPFFIGEWV
jgi:hypothetical protein